MLPKGSPARAPPVHQPTRLASSGTWSTPSPPTPAGSTAATSPDGKRQPGRNERRGLTRRCPRRGRRRRRTDRGGGSGGWRQTRRPRRAPGASTADDRSRRSGRSPARPRWRAGSSVVDPAATSGPEAPTTPAMPRTADSPRVTEAGTDERSGADGPASAARDAAWPPFPVSTEPGSAGTLDRKRLGPHDRIHAASRPGCRTRTPG